MLDIKKNGKRKIRSLLTKVSPIYRLQKSLENDINALRHEVKTQSEQVEQIIRAVHDKLATTEELMHHNTTSMLADIDRLRLSVGETDKKIATKLDMMIDVQQLPRATGTLRDVQDISLEMLKTVDAICKKHKLEYWLDFGTLLGAVRHKGFIPWDDDMDISIMNTDYEKLLAVIDQELENTDFRFIRVPAQIGKMVHKDFMPQGKDEIAKFINWDMRDKIMFALDITPYYYAKETISTSQLDKAIVQATQEKMMTMSKGATYDSFLEADKVVSKLHKKLVSKKPSSKVFMGMECMTVMLATRPWVVSTEDVFPLAKVEFEGSIFPAPRSTEQYLTSAYGDYMQLPGDINYHLHLDNVAVSELKKVKRAASGFDKQ